MNKYLLRTLLLVSLAACVAGLGCSGEKDTAEDKGGRDKITTPIQRAQETRRLGDDRLQEIDRALNER
jgi:hypothetical protein